MRGSGRAIVVVVVLLTGCSSDDPPERPASSPRTEYRAPPSAAEGGYDPTFAPTPCPPSVPADPALSCGVLTVPERHERPDGRKVRLSVATLASRSPSPAPDPLLILVGGPGDSGLAAVEGFLTSSARDTHTIIFVDQRGTGASTPNLACPELDARVLPELGARPGDAGALEARLDATRACRARLVDEGVDLAAYTSAQSAADIADLRLALDIPEWNVQGTSYGTRLALTLLRDHPQGIRTLVLDSTVPLQVDERDELRPNAQRAFDELFAGCAAAPRCRAAYGDLEDRAANLVRRLQTEPVTATATDPTTGAPVTVVLDGDRLVSSLFGGLYATDLLPVLPSLIAAADNGDVPAVVQAIVSETRERLDSFSRGMNLSVVCGEEMPFSTRDAGAAELFGLTPELDVLVPEQCDVWNVPAAHPVESQPVRGPVPTLIVAGEYDPVTPPAWGRLAAETLPASFFVEFPGQGHGEFTNDCPRSVRASFLARPRTRPDVSCVARMGAPQWVTPSPS
jgi:pimeloyl-ACP methyl ester carboxylesterase